MAIDSLQRGAPAGMPTTAEPRAAALQPLVGLLPLATRDRFVAGMAPGLRGGTKSAMYSIIPLAILSMEGAVPIIPKALKAAMPFGASTGGLIGMTVVLAGTGAVVGGAVNATTHHRIWAPVMGAASGGFLLGGVRGLQTKSWQGAVAGLVFGGITGYFAGKAVVTKN